MGDHYQYQPLSQDPAEIRIIDTVAGSSPPRYQLKHVSLASDPKPRYKTISYYWGDPTPSHAIIVDGKLLHIPQNAAKALAQIADEVGQHAIWLDAVCIDQKNIDERERQVALMGRVFSSSSGNIVHLGDEDEFTDRALANIAACHREIQASLGPGQDLLDLAIQDGRDEYADQPSKAFDDSEAVMKFFSCPWFR